MARAEKHPAAHERQVRIAPDLHAVNIDESRRKPVAMPEDPGVFARRTPGKPSNIVFNWLIGAGLLILIAVLAAVLINAGSHVEVLP